MRDFERKLIMDGHMFMVTHDGMINHWSCGCGQIEIPHETLGRIIEATNIVWDGFNVGDAVTLLVKLGWAEWES